MKAFLNIFTFLLLAASLNGQNLLLSELSPVQKSKDKNVEQERYANFNFNFEMKSFTLNPFVGINVDIDFERTEEHYRSRVWVGKVRGSKSDYLYVTQSGTEVHAKLNLHTGRIVLMQPQKSGKYRVQYYYPSTISEGEDMIFPNGQMAPSANAEDHCDTVDTCVPKTVDLMVVYTDSARNEFGGTDAAAVAGITTAIAEMNTANIGTNITHTYALVYVNFIDYTESGSSGTDLSRLRSTTDNIIDTIHQIRAAVGADAVAMCIGYGGCGVAYVATSASGTSASSLFNISERYCTVIQYTMAHEFGHNFGLHHNWGASNSTTPCMWHHGYQNANATAGSPASEKWRTILSYSCSGFTCPRNGLWSDADNTHNGDPLGVDHDQTDPADNAFGLERTLCTVADVFSPALSVEMASFDARVENLKVILDWSTSSEINNAGFEIQRSLDGTDNFESVGWVDGQGFTTDVNLYQFVDDQAFASVIYYRLKQVDHDGVFEFTDTRVVNGRVVRFASVLGNPASGSVQILFGSPVSEDTRVRLISGNGQTVQTWSPNLNSNFQDYKLDDAIVPGMYFLEMYNSNRSDVFRLMVE